MPYNRLEIKPPIPGRIEQVLVDEGEGIKQGQILAWMSSADRATLLDAARAKGPAELKYWEDVYKPTPIVAPLDGFIILRNVEPGQSVSATDAVLVMADHLIVKAQVDETDLSQIKLNQPVVIVLDAYPDKKVDGRVEHIAYESTVINNVTIYYVDVLPMSVPSFFRSGMSATANFILSEKKDVLLVPLNAIRKKNNRSYVFVKDQSGKIVPKEITTGLENSSNIELVSGLSEGDEIYIPTSQMVKDFMSNNRGFRMTNPFGPRSR
jgi:macrolide-specific efflux system membrane fusion protein